MNIDVSHKMYVYPQFEKEINYALIERESLTICGIASGKRRLIKHCLHELNLIDVGYLINVHNLLCDCKESDLALKIERYFHELYNKGVRVYILEEVPFENKLASTILNSLEHFRKNSIDRICFVFLSELDPKIELREMDVTCRNLLIQKVIYQNLQDRDLFTFTIEQNELRYDLKINDSDKKIIRNLSGNIPILVKYVCKAISNKSEFSKLEIYDSIMQELLDSMPYKSILYLKLLSANSLSEDSVVEYLENVGIVNSKGQIISSLLSSYIETYVRDGVVKNDGKNFVFQGLEITNYFTISQRLLLCELIEKKSISRDFVKKIFSPQTPEDYSESAIDKSMSRLRKKLSSIGINPEIISTDKKSGFRYTF